MWDVPGDLISSPVQAHGLYPSMLTHSHPGMRANGQHLDYDKMSRPDTSLPFYPSAIHRAYPSGHDTLGPGMVQYYPAPGETWRESHVASGDSYSGR